MREHIDLARPSCIQLEGLIDELTVDTLTHMSELVAVAVDASGILAQAASVVADVLACPIEDLLATEAAEHQIEGCVLREEHVDTLSCVRG